MFFPNRLVDHVPLAPLTCLMLLVYSPTALRTTPVRRALGVPVQEGLPPQGDSSFQWVSSARGASPPNPAGHLPLASSGLPTQALCPGESQARRPCLPRPCGPSGGCSLACCFPHLFPSLPPHEPPPSTENQMAGAPAAPDRERLDRGGGGAALEQHVFHRVTWRLAPAPSCDAAAWLGPKPSSGILRGPGPRTRHPSTL
ncbi:PREDICTED: uncharacterized protein LOC104996958 [Bison bison bison]|uniref:Uncharacterized protein LOC104996958 n=1 Tax=Bison bison bison TaxID=43346 RepID=A0A6P3I4T2_BISBB|nr:PREDICTED: uncharacterized protein LOC104996958 [Bison bison bison]XP_010849661.1 PREDICTED: uncharacterized protein LOC104996958 [Bison bison bison]